jgi:anti-sigma-K factor RskA
MKRQQQDICGGFGRQGVVAVALLAALATALAGQWQQWVRQHLTKMVVVMAAAHAETEVAVVAEAEANASENRDSGSGIDGDGSGNIGVGGGSDNGRWQR